MRSAASLAPMVTSGTPVPGRVLAPTKYMPSTLRETIGGRKDPTPRVAGAAPHAPPPPPVLSSRPASGVFTFS